MDRGIRSCVGSRDKVGKIVENCVGIREKVGMGL